MTLVASSLLLLVAITNLLPSRRKPQRSEAQALCQRTVPGSKASLHLSSAARNDDLLVNKEEVPIC